MRPTADDQATNYALDIIDGKVIAGEFAWAAAQRHLKDLEDGAARGLRYDVAKAKHHCGFFPAVLSVTEGVAEGKPFNLLPWHGFVIASVFGWLRQDGFRRFRMAWMETGKGQAKSPLMAGVGLDMLGYAGKERSEVYAIAGDKDQANVLFKDAVAMCRVTIPECDDGDTLEARGEVVIRGTGDHAWKIEHPTSSSKFQSLASQDSISGPRPHCILADEIHEFKSAYSLQLWKAAIDKMSSDPLMMLGTNTPASNQIVGTEYSEMFQKVVTGQATDDTLFAFIARVDKKDQEKVFDNEACWIKALPALGVTYPIDNVRSRVNTARLMLSEALSTKRLYFGIPVGTDGFWTTEEAWDSCVGVVDEEEVKDWDCHLGLDLSKKNDLTALSAAWRRDLLCRVKTWYYTTKNGLPERARDDNAPYEEWVEQKWLTATNGATIDYEFIARKVQDLCSRFKVKFLAFDPAKIDDFIDACDEIGFPVWRYEGPKEPKGKGLMLVSHGQKTRVVFTEKALCMPKSIEKFEDLILEKRVIVDRSPVTKMCASNAKIMADELNNRAFDKKRSRGRIDGMISITQAVGASFNELDTQKEPEFKVFFV